MAQSQAEERQRHGMAEAVAVVGRSGRRWLGSQREGRVLHGVAVWGVWRGGRVVRQGGGRVVDGGVGVWTSQAARWREGFWERWGRLAAGDGKAGGTRYGRWADLAQGVVEWEALTVPCHSGEEAWNARSGGVEQGVFAAGGDRVGDGLLRRSWGRKGRLAGDEGDGGGGVLPEMKEMAWVAVGDKGWPAGVVVLVRGLAGFWEDGRRGFGGLEDLGKWWVCSHMQYNRGRNKIFRGNGLKEE